MVIASLHPVGGHDDVSCSLSVKSIVYLVIGCSFSWGTPNSKSQGRPILLNTMLEGIIPVVVWVGTVLVSRTRGSRLIPITFLHQNELPQLVLHSLNIAFYHSI
jgi:hypothetical protein